MKVFVGDPTGLSEKNRRFHSETLVEDLMHAGYKVDGPWALTPPRCTLYDFDPTQQKWHGLWLALSQAVGKQTFAMIEAADVVLVMMESEELLGVTAAAMGYAYALSKPVIIYKDAPVPVFGTGYARVGLPAEFLAGANGGTVVCSMKELMEELRDLEPTSMEATVG